MDDGGRCLLDVIGDPLLLESFLDEDTAASANAQASSNSLGKSNLTTASAHPQLYIPNYGRLPQTSLQAVPTTNLIAYNGDLKTLRNVPVCSSIPIKPPAAPSSQVIPHSNAPSPSLFNSPSPTIATSVLSPAVPSPSQSATVGPAPNSAAGGVIQQLPTRGQVQVANQPGNPQQFFQVITPVPQQRAQVVIRPKQPQILPKPPGGVSHPSNVPVATKPTSMGTRNVSLGGLTQGVQPGTQLVMNQPANTILPPHAQGQTGMILIHTNQGPYLIPINGAGMIPGLQFMLRPPVTQTVPTSAALNQNQILAPIQVAGQQTIVGDGKSIPGNQQTIVIPTNAVPGTFPSNNLVLNNNTIHTAQVPSSQAAATSTPGMILGPRIVNGSGQGMQFQQMQTPQGPITVALQPGQVVVPTQNYVRRPQPSAVPMAPLINQRTIHAPTPPPVQSPKPELRKPKGVDLAELLKEHGIATDEDGLDSKPLVVPKEEPPKTTEQSQSLVLSLAQDGSIQLQPPSTYTTTLGSAPQTVSSSSYMSHNHSVLLERLNSAPVNGVVTSSQSPLIPITVQQMPSLKPTLNTPSSPAVVTASSIAQSVTAPTSTVASVPTTMITQDGMIVAPISSTASANTQGSQKLQTYQLSLGNQQLDKSVQMSASLHHYANVASMQQPNCQTSINHGQNLQLTNILKRPVNNLSAPSMIQTVIQPQMMINTSVAPSLSLNTATSTISTVPTSNIKLGQQVITLTQQKNAVNHIQLQNRTVIPEQQNLLIQKNNQQQLILKVQQPPSNSESGFALTNTSIPPGTLYRLQPVNKPIIASTVTAQVKLEPKQSLKRPLVPKAALFQQALAKHQEKALTPHTKTPFKSKKDAVERLLPFHVFESQGQTAKKIRETDIMFEAISRNLLGKMHRMVNKYHHLLLKDSMKEVSSIELVMLNRMFVEEETASLKADKKAASEGIELDLPPIPESWLKEETIDENEDEIESPNTSSPKCERTEPIEKVSEEEKIESPKDDLSSEFYPNEHELNSPSNVNDYNDSSGAGYVDFEPPIMKGEKRDSSDSESSSPKPPKIFKIAEPMFTDDSTDNNDSMFSPMSNKSSPSDNDVRWKPVRTEHNIQVENAIHSILNSPTTESPTPSPAPIEYSEHFNGVPMDEDFDDNDDDDDDESAEPKNDDLDEAIRSILM